MRFQGKNPLEPLSKNFNVDNDLIVYILNNKGLGEIFLSSTRAALKSWPNIQNQDRRILLATMVSMGKSMILNWIPVFIILGMLPLDASAQFYDQDGQLAISWSPPRNSDSLSHFVWEYVINGVADSVTGTAAADDTLDQSVVLTYSGDWALFSIRSVSINFDTSAAAVSDTAFYYSGCAYIQGDANGDTRVNGLDVVYLVGYLKTFADPYLCLCGENREFYPSADCNGDCQVNGTDVIYLVNYFKGGQEIAFCHDCPPERSNR